MSVAITVTAAATWLTLVSDPTQSVQVFKTERHVTTSLDQSAVRVYAGGRRRIITTPSDLRQTPLTLRKVSDAQLVTLDSWRGQVLCLRDFQGWRKFGTFFGLDTVDWFHGAGSEPLHNVTVTFVDVTYVEGV